MRVAGLGGIGDGSEHPAGGELERLDNILGGGFDATNDDREDNADGGQKFFGEPVFVDAELFDDDPADGEYSDFPPAGLYDQGDDGEYEERYADGTGEASMQLASWGPPVAPVQPTHWHPPVVPQNNSPERALVDPLIAQRVSGFGTEGHGEDVSQVDFRPSTFAGIRDAIGAAAARRAERRAAQDEFDQATQTWAARTTHFDREILPGILGDVRDSIDNEDAGTLATALQTTLWYAKEGGFPYEVLGNGTIAAALREAHMSAVEEELGLRTIDVERSIGHSGSHLPARISEEGLTPLTKGLLGGAQLPDDAMCDEKERIRRRAQVFTDGAELISQAARNSKDRLFVDLGDPDEHKRRAFELMAKELDLKSTEWSVVTDPNGRETFLVHDGRVIDRDPDTGQVSLEQTSVAGLTKVFRAVGAFKNMQPGFGVEGVVDLSSELAVVLEARHYSDRIVVEDDVTAIISTAVDPAVVTQQGRAEAYRVLLGALENNEGVSTLLDPRGAAELAVLAKAVVWSQASVAVGEITAAARRAADSLPQLPGLISGENARAIGTSALLQLNGRPNFKYKIDKKAIRSMDSVVVVYNTI